MKVEVKLQEKTSCVTSFISWARLERNLKLSGELRLDESITNLVADEDGIKYYVSKEKIELQKEESSVK